jgi:hypothetical protein
MNSVVDMPGLITMREFVELDDGKWWLTEKVIVDPLLRRRLVRTQIEELVALWKHYPLQELGSVAQILQQLQQAYDDVKPFNHTLMAE